MPSPPATVAELQRLLRVHDHELRTLLAWVYGDGLIIGPNTRLTALAFRLLSTLRMLDATIRNFVDGEIRDRIGRVVAQRLEEAPSECIVSLINFQYLLVGTPDEARPFCLDVRSGEELDEPPQTPIYLSLVILPGQVEQMTRHDIERIRRDPSTNTAVVEEVADARRRLAERGLLCDDAGSYPAG